ncbi:hypothetical protein [Aurantiacibacter suaedae]|uniref:hypothetical protein n=1 Tax=Aurantiacibacter suaedae TaxID=2545755 RepID=UPI0010F58216|nr:hypothetical protein [Aurantiacibacter suaedae]
MKRTKLCRFSAVALLVAIIAPVGANAQDALNGASSDLETGKIVRGVRVTLNRLVDQNCLTHSRSEKSRSTRASRSDCSNLNSLSVFGHSVQGVSSITFFSTPLWDAGAHFFVYFNDEVDEVVASFVANGATNLGCEGRGKMRHCKLQYRNGEDFGVQNRQKGGSLIVQEDRSPGELF